MKQEKKLHIEVKAGKPGYNDRRDPMREKAEKIMKGDFADSSKPFSPESRSSPGNSKILMGFKEGGHVKYGHRIPTNLHLPKKEDGVKFKDYPQTRVKKMGGVMQGDHGPLHGSVGHSAAIQGQQGPRYKKGGHLPHKGIGGDIQRGFQKFGRGVKQATHVIEPYAKSAYNAAKPVLREVAKKGIDYGSKALGAAATGAATAIGGPGAGAAAGYLASKGTKALGNYATRKAGLKHGGNMMAHHAKKKV